MNWLEKIFNKDVLPASEVLFSREVPQPRKLLFIFPLDHEQFLDSIEVFKELQRYRADDTIQLAVPMQHKNETPGSIHKVFFFPVIKEKTNRIDVDVLKARYKHELFDAVVNLDPEVDRYMAKVIQNLSTPKRIGFSNVGADEVYNIQIDPEEPEFLTGSYAQILALCDLGDPVAPPQQAKS